MEREWAFRRCAWEQESFSALFSNHVKKPKLNYHVTLDTHFFSNSHHRCHFRLWRHSGGSSIHRQGHILRCTDTHGDQHSEEFAREGMNMVAR